MAAREVLLAQSLDWADMVHDGIDAQYAEEEFKKNILAFTTVFDALGANSISTEWLTKIEAEHSVFPWMNYRMFSKNSSQEKSFVISFNSCTNVSIDSFVVEKPKENLTPREASSLSVPIASSTGRLIFRLEQAEPVEMAMPFSDRARTRTCPGSPLKAA